MGLRAEEEANERRKKRFAREREIEVSKANEGEMSAYGVNRLDGLTIGSGGAKGRLGKKVGKRFFGEGVEEAQFDPVCPPRFSLGFDGLRTHVDMHAHRCGGRIERDRLG